MKLVFLIGNTAVGKMTVGQELMKLTDLRLFHNHMSIELVLDVFGHFNKDAISRMRKVVFEEFSKTNQYGMIFTYIWAFDSQSDWDAVEEISNTFKEQGATVYYVELLASKEIRQQRNSSKNRLEHKPSKRNIEFSNQLFEQTDKDYRCVSYDGEIPYKNYLRLDNSSKTPLETAHIIKEHFSL